MLKLGHRYLAPTEFSLAELIACITIATAIQDQTKYLPFVDDNKFTTLVMLAAACINRNGYDVDMPVTAIVSSKSDTLPVLDEEILVATLKAWSLRKQKAITAPNDPIMQIDRVYPFPSAEAQDYIDKKLGTLVLVLGPLGFFKSLE